MNLCRIAINFVLLLCAPTALQATTTSNPYADPFSVVKTVRPDYVLYEPPLVVTALLPSQRIPVVVYMHGWLGNNELAYERIMSDMAVAGCAVLFPRFEGAEPFAWQSAYFDAVSKTIEGLQDLESGSAGYLAASPLCPDPDRWAIVGHSTGGMYSLKFAHDAPLLGLGAPKTIVLHDAGGFGSMFETLTPQPFQSTWLDDLSGIAAETRLVLLAAERSWWCEVAEHFDGDAILFGNTLLSGVWSRAWHFTSNAMHKTAMVVPGGHTGVQNGSTDQEYLPYRELTVRALDVAFRGGSMGMNPSGTWDLAPSLDLPDFRPSPWSQESNLWEELWCLF